MEIRTTAKAESLAPDDVPVTLAEQEHNAIVVEGGKKRLLVGMGARNGICDRRAFILLARKVIAAAKGYRIKLIAIDARDWKFPKLKLAPSELGELIATNMIMANFEFVAFKTRPKEGWNTVERLTVIGAAPGFQAGFKRGVLIGEEVNACRALANTPGSDMTPRILAEKAKEAFRGTRARVTVLDLPQIKALGMGGIVGVSQGSSQEPAFIIAEYFQGKKKEKPLVLVGKGVTFDTGGINLKPTQALTDMHMDMSGGAAVIHAIALAARLKLKKNIVGLIPAAENMPSGSSYRPGDILRTMSGTTIEVTNTDAEGRVILADALTYAKKYDPRLVIDVATLTGAAMVALGLRASALFSNKESLVPRLRTLGEITGDYLWPLPLWREYEEDIRGTFGDILNSSKVPYGGAITGAIFLHQFAKEYPWVHIDIAPRMTSIEGEYLAKGAAGSPVRLLLKAIEKL